MHNDSSDYFDQRKGSDRYGTNYNIFVLYDNNSLTVNAYTVVVVMCALSNLHR